MKHYTEKLCKALEIRGLINIQFAIKGDKVYVIEANPRASRTVPYVSKATGIQLAKVAARCMAGRSLAEQGIERIAMPLETFVPALTGYMR